MKLALSKFLLPFLLFATPALRASMPSLRVGLTGKYPPFNYYNSQGNLTGFDVDFANHLCKELNRKCEFIPVAWDGILSALLAGKIDAIIASMAITEERKKKAAFSIPYYESGAQLFVTPKSPSPHSENFRIGVTLGTTYKTFASQHFPRASLRMYKGDIEILQDISQGRLDGMLTDRLVGLYLSENAQTSMTPWGEPLYLEQMGIAIQLNQTKLLKELNHSIKNLRASSNYPLLLEKYFGKHSRPKKGSFSLSSTLALMGKALWVTLSISFQGLILGFLLASALAGGVLFFPSLISRSISFFIDFIRATPFMVQLFAIYFGLPSIDINLSPHFSAILAIAIHSSAYLAEIFKTAYQNVPLHQHFAAKSLGISTPKTFYHVILPQMLPLLITPSLNTTVAMIKDSALISIISVHELMMQTQELISATFQPLEYYSLAALLYFLLTFPLLLIGRRLERQFKQRGLLHG